MSRRRSLTQKQIGEIVRLCARRRALHNQAAREATTIVRLARELAGHVARHDAFEAAARELTNMRLASQYHTSHDTVSKLARDDIHCGSAA